MVKDRALPVLVSITTLAMVGFNFAAAALPLFGRSTADVSGRFPLLITPAGYTFYIWSAIFITLLIYCGEQFVDPLASSPVPRRLALPLIVSNIANILWLVLWHSLQILLSVPVMLVLLGSLIVAYRSLGWTHGELEPRSLAWGTRAPISLYLGWISFAAIANIGVAVYSTGLWRALPFEQATLAAGTLILTVALPIAALVMEKNTIYAAVFVWAYIGIVVGQNDRLVVWTAATLAVGVALGIAFVVSLRRRLV